MYKDLIKYVCLIKLEILRSLIDGNIDLMSYEPSATWINDNLSFMKKIYFFMPKDFDFDEIIEEGRYYNEEVYKLISSKKGKRWMGRQMLIIKDLLEN